ncbi:FAD/NAD(P)-binding domain-containing protein [Cucurbitaria berberidis CBS 394.84]|uniref:FAD/NAD(P)-binding domain-containing protein n=1 Tax=Cucurbitaria berberidis CBS 394.84 TaxID=1168544 RepID=A0A9P4GGB6_9PLEO|nr:FAD/NAD(P)-binding domain-containing protein [Cucurbitaria berberidis CBS 394.84]KAF1845102.1 FAD/NAD(P)-binding domain-containing protein [Cucurbitaria berberidis CBS 394.84]
MKIIIVGGGIAGLSTYLHLRKHLPNPSTHTITIYESHRPSSRLTSTSQTSAPINTLQHLDLDTFSSSTALVGGGLGISPNGMRVLRDLDPELHHRVVAQGFPAEQFVFKGANGWTLGVQSTSDKAFRSVGEEEEVCIASSRHGLWETIMRFVEGKNNDGESVVKHAQVVGVERDGRRGLSVRTRDAEGMEEVDEADLVIGADGVKSVWPSLRLTALMPSMLMLFSGQSGVGGFLNAPIPPFIADNKAMVFAFGGNGFFGYSSGGPLAAKQLMWWSTFETDSLPDTKSIDPQAIKTALLERHKQWKDPIVQDIVQKANVESIYPTWTLPTLPHWGERGIVLVGDAAHAMDPTTGQGASQALEDSQTFALLLAGLLERADEQVDEAIKLFHEIRAPRINAIVERGKKLAGRKANIGVVAEYFIYSFLWLLMKFPSIGKFVLGDVNRELYCWSPKDEVRKALVERKNEGDSEVQGKGRQVARDYLKTR